MLACRVSNKNHSIALYFSERSANSSMLSALLWSLLALFAESDSGGGDATKVYAMYFPQFHEDKLNNYLWGKGFTGAPLFMS